MDTCLACVANGQPAATCHSSIQACLQLSDGHNKQLCLDCIQRSYTDSCVQCAAAADSQLCYDCMAMRVDKDKCQGQTGARHRRLRYCMARLQMLDGFVAHGYMPVISCGCVWMCSCYICYYNNELAAAITYYQVI